jgi:hypothetical protein
MGLLLGAVVAGTAAILYFRYWPRDPAPAIDYKVPGNPQPKIDAAKAALIERREKLVDQTIWAKEMQAQQNGRVIEDYWDTLNASTNRFQIAGNLSFKNLTLGAWNSIENLPHQIERRTSTNVGAIQTLSEFESSLQLFSQQGWSLLQCEFRHTQFDPQTNYLPARSQFYFSAHLTNANPDLRAAIHGNLKITWALRTPNDPPAINSIDASALTIDQRQGPLPFTPILTERFANPPKADSSDALIIYDLDHDGFPEILWPGANRLYHRTAVEPAYRLEPLFAYPPNELLSALIADFDGDGVPDFLFMNFSGFMMIKGSPTGRFDAPARRVCNDLSSSINFIEPRAMTCGDIDGDGDLDVFVGQYKAPYVGGSMPTPYYDANDGAPSCLFINNGQGQFTEQTAAAGLGKKRFRRVLAASFVDIDGDHSLDLVTSSDFAGVDIYRNDGSGHFTDITATAIDAPHAFGMGHAFADFNRDGRLDYLMSGMTSATVDRLEHLNLRRPQSALDPAMRAQMPSGNQLYFARPGGGFAKNGPEGSGQLGASIASGGWAWGVAVGDIDNDGWPDAYIANGHESQRSVRDYEGDLWLRDMFVANSAEEIGPRTYFEAKGQRKQREQASLGGHDKNRLFLNSNGASFLELGHLFGIALEADSRNLALVDLNQDGRLDIIVMSQDFTSLERNILRIFQNNLPPTNSGNWLEFNFVEEPGFPSPIGTVVTLDFGDHKLTQQLITGDTFRTQQPSTLHFGLGSKTNVPSVEIIWPEKKGRTQTWVRPLPNQKLQLRRASQ